MPINEHEQGLRDPPQVKGWPLLGNLPQVRARPVDFLVDAAAEHGPVFRLTGPGIRVTVIHGALAQELALHNESLGMHRKGIYDVFARETGVDIFAAQGADHMQKRTLLRLGLSRQIVGQYVPDLARTIVAQARGWKPGSHLSLYKETNEMVLGALMAAMTPYDLSARVPDVVRIAQDAMYAISRLRPKWSLWNPRYWLARNRVRAEVDKAIAAHRAGTYANQVRTSMLDGFIAARDGGGAALDDLGLRGACVYSLAGTSVYLTPIIGFMLFHILRDASLYGRVQAEVDAAFSGEDGLNPAVFRRMKWLRAAYFEALRKYVVVPGLGFVTSREIEIGGYRIKAGEELLLTPVPDHFDPEVYSDPLRFDAGRCTAPRNEHRCPMAHAPFGRRPRTCAATGLVELFIFTVVASVLRGAILRLPSPTYRPKLSVQPLLQDAGGFPAVVEEIRADISGDPDALLKRGVVAPDPGMDALVLPETETVTLAAGECVYAEGDTADAFFVVLTGVVGLAAGSSNSDGDALPLGSGSSFGEVEILAGNSRRTSALARDDTTLLKVSRDAMIETLVESDMLASELGEALYMRHLQATLTRAFPALDPEAAQALAPEFETCHYPSGAVVMNQGEVGEHLFIVVTGRAEVWFDDPGGGTSQLATLNQGQIFGEIGLRSNRRRTATVKAHAEEALNLLSLSRDRFQRLVQEHPTIGEGFAEVIEQRLLEILDTLGL